MSYTIYLDFTPFIFATKFQYLMDNIFRKILNETGFSNIRYMANANSQRHRMVNSAHHSQNGVNFSNLVNWLVGLVLPANSVFKH
jgi:hypothetical protein